MVSTDMVVEENQNPALFSNSDDWPQGFSLVANLSNKDNEGFRIKCQKCKIYFAICSNCYRGHRYCGETCRVMARKASQKKASSRYSKKPAARRLHRLRQNRYRKKKADASPFL